MQNLSTVRKKAVPAAVVGVLLTAGVAYAASPAPNTDTLGTGDNTVTSCNASAGVAYDTTYSSTLPGYKVTTAPVTSAVACAGMSYELTLSGAGDLSLAEVTGSLDGTGAATPDFASDDVPASLVTGVRLVITG